VLATTIRHPDTAHLAALLDHVRELLRRVEPFEGSRIRKTRLLSVAVRSRLTSLTPASAVWRPAFHHSTRHVIRLAPLTPRHTHCRGPLL
jgi:hypothetical protein